METIEQLQLTRDLLSKCAKSLKCREDEVEGRLKKMLSEVNVLNAEIEKTKTELNARSNKD